MGALIRAGALIRVAAAVAVTTLISTACVAPSQKVIERAHALNWSAWRMQGEGFEHLVLASPNWRAGRRLHVYIEHDGRPFDTPLIPAQDPTPAFPVALRLMELDTTPAVYLGRPCYYGAGPRSACGPAMWTSGRYSERVLNSLQSVLGSVLRQRLDTEITLIGHSGGGTLAVLLAERLPQVSEVITLAGNLQVARWAGLHGYSALTESLDPQTRPPLPASIRQLHVAGARDTNVPAHLVRAYAEHQPCVRVIELDDVDHLCCWHAHWPRLLSQLPAGVGDGQCRVPPVNVE